MGWTMWPTKINIMVAGRRQNRVLHEALGFSLKGYYYRASSWFYTWSFLDYGPSLVRFVILQY